VLQGHQAKRYYVSGIVQGVGFRYFARQVAERLGIAGYAKNLRDGRVEVYAIAPPAALETLRAELKRGPRAAMVSGVAEEDAAVDPEYARDFSIERDTW
jgi:acylphosphatase